MFNATVNSVNVNAQLGAVIRHEHERTDSVRLTICELTKKY